jgi:hypothetical protein
MYFLLQGFELFNLKSAFFNLKSPGSTPPIFSAPPLTRQNGMPPGGFPLLL